MVEWFEPKRFLEGVCLPPWLKFALATCSSSMLLGTLRTILPLVSPFSSQAIPRSSLKVVAYEANARRLTLSEPLPFLPEVGEPLELDSGMEAPVLAANLVLANEGLDLSSVNLSLRLATTRCTNALLEGKGVSPVFFVTRGFRDLLRIGDQRRLGLFDLCPRGREPLHGEVIEVSERLDRNGEVIEPIDFDDLREQLRALPAESSKVAAVSLLHSYANSLHEEMLAEFLRSEGFSVVAESSALHPFAKWLPRAESAVIEAYLTPVLKQYLDDVSAFIDTGTLRVMTSAGGLVGKNDYRSVDSLLSGPAGGVVGAVAVAQRAGLLKIIALDMGGTSADVSRFDGDFDYRDRHEVGSALVSAPALKIETVAAGGGSICRLEGDLLCVGPESAGARPGPACYGFGGPLCLTDVNLLLGRLSPEHFASPVFPKESELRLEEMLRGSSRSHEETLLGFLDVANDAMAGAIRKVSVREGYDPADYALVAFGGAGGQHACGVAEKLGITRVLSPADAGLLSAYGLSKASLERFAERQVMRPLLETDCSPLEEELATEALDALSRESTAERFVERLPFSVYQGRMPHWRSDYSDIADLRSLFEDRYREVFGYVPKDGLIEIVSLRVIASVKVESDSDESFSSSASGAQGVERFFESASPCSENPVAWGSPRWAYSRSRLFRHSFSRVGLAWAGRGLWQPSARKDFHGRSAGAECLRPPRSCRPRTVFQSFPYACRGNGGSP